MFFHCDDTNSSSGQGEIPDRQYSLRAIWLIRRNPVTDGKVRMKGDNNEYRVFTVEDVWKLVLLRQL